MYSPHASFSCHTGFDEMIYPLNLDDYISTMEIFYDIR